MKRMAFAAGLLGAVAASSAAAALSTGSVASAPHEAARYQMYATDKGYVRLDTHTGEVSVCREEADDLVCRLSADDRAAYADRIEALADENERLGAALASEGAGEANPVKEPPRGLSQDRPVGADVGEAIGLIDYVARRLLAASRTIDAELRGAEAVDAPSDRSDP